MNVEEQGRVWVLSQKCLYESPQLDKLLSNLQVLCNVYKHSCDDEEFIDTINKMIERVKNYRTHAVIRKQKEIQELKCDVDDLISDMIKTIDPKIMTEFNIFETQ